MDIDPAIWSVRSMAPSANRGTFDIEVTDGEHVIRFEACSDGGAQEPLAWAIEQVRAFDERAFRLACLHCPDEGAPTRPALWDADEAEEGE
ncbi:MAG: hypothetical protein HY873_13120 [Chloroflexi bacterium]|nr:hypothetical protein [Chloroflexota bacterium]